MKEKVIIDVGAISWNDIKTEYLPNTKSLIMGIRAKEVITCKDCKYWQEPIEQSGYKYPSQCTRDERAYMEECAILMDADDFCSRGEKR